MCVCVCVRVCVNTHAHKKNKIEMKRMFWFRVSAIGKRKSVLFNEIFIC